MNENQQTYFQLYADDSSRSPHVVVGGFVLLPDLTAKFENGLSKLKEKFDGPVDGRLHCRELFAYDKRKKSVWKHLQRTDVFELYKELAYLLNETAFSRLIVHADRSKLPRSFPGNNDFPEIRLGEKELAAWCGNIFATPFVMEAGVEHIQLFVDSDKTKIDWLGKRRQVISAINIYVDTGNDGQTKRIQVEKDKPALLDAADAVAFVSSRVLAGIKSDLCEFRQIFEILNVDHVRLRLTQQGAFSPHVPTSLIERIREIRQGS